MASSAIQTCGALRSASEKTATLAIRISRSARITRTAISPRLATSILRNKTDTPNQRCTKRGLLLTSFPLRDNFLAAVRKLCCIICNTIVGCSTDKVGPFMPSCRSVLRMLVILTGGLVSLAVPALTQTFYGSVLGTVTDSSGANMANAKVSITNNATAERRTAETTSDGAYRFVNLIPGTYRVDVEQTGFKRYSRDGIGVNVDASLRIDVAMQLGDIGQQVEVTSAAPLLQTENASLSQVVGSRSVEELPLNGRNVLNLAAISPGVVLQ